MRVRGCVPPCWKARITRINCMAGLRCHPRAGPFTTRMWHWSIGSSAHLRPAEKIYLAHSAFLSRLLVDWRTRTEDPWDADLIYVPALT